eukprot:NODE_106_length_19060_cov_0.700227.p10 type:complete len:264 gc:universal NODE_106_length_19060_cov_0.700227:8185-8976(+)
MNNTSTLALLLALLFTVWSIVILQRDLKRGFRSELFGALRLALLFISGLFVGSARLNTYSYDPIQQRMVPPPEEVRIALKTTMLFCFGGVLAEIYGLVLKRLKAPDTIVNTVYSEMTGILVGGTNLMVVVLDVLGRDFSLLWTMIMLTIDFCTDVYIARRMYMLKEYTTSSEHMSIFRNTLTSMVFYFGFMLSALVNMFSQNAYVAFIDQIFILLCFGSIVMSKVELRGHLEQIKEKEEMAPKHETAKQGLLYEEDGLRMDVE